MLIYAMKNEWHIAFRINLEHLVYERVLAAEGCAAFNIVFDNIGFRFDGQAEQDHDSSASTFFFFQFGVYVESDAR